MQRHHRRPYRSAVRAEQARLTRDRILAAARDLFVERGYAGASMSAIAAAAGVAPETVYDIFASKRRLLEETAAREEESGERSWEVILSLPGIEARLLEWARLSAGEAARVGPVLAVLRTAAASEPELAAVYSDLQERRFASHRRVLEAIAGRSPRLDLDAAADTLGALASPELHHLLTAVRGWSQARYAQWLEGTVLRSVLSTPSWRG